MSVEIDIRRTNGGVQRRELLPGKYIIGRETGHIILSDPGVSIRHAELRVTETTITLTDLGSTNGSFDGSTRLSAPTRMTMGRPLRLGGCTLTLVPPATEAPAPSPISDVPVPRSTRPWRVLALAALLGVASLGWSVWRAAGHSASATFSAGSD